MPAQEALTRMRRAVACSTAFYSGGGSRELQWCYVSVRGLELSSVLQRALEASQCTLRLPRVLPELLSVHQGSFLWRINLNILCACTAAGCPTAVGRRVFPVSGPVRNTAQRSICQSLTPLLLQHPHVFPPVMTSKRFSVLHTVLELPWAV